MQIMRIDRAVGAMTNMPPLDLPPCCACGGVERVHTIYLLEDALAPEPGTGWGCQVCGLESNGAMAVVCDTCHAARVPVGWVVDGALTDGRRAPIEEHRGVWTHDLARHGERSGWSEGW